MIFNISYLSYNDSIHATIEGFIRRRVIWAPSEWPTIIANERTNPQNYNITMMTPKNYNSMDDPVTSFVIGNPF